MNEEKNVRRYTPPSERKPHLHLETGRDKHTPFTSSGADDTQIEKETYL
jgi:hypothetical protein